MSVQTAIHTPLTAEGPLERMIQLWMGDCPAHWSDADRRQFVIDKKGLDPRAAAYREARPYAEEWTRRRIADRKVLPEKAEIDMHLFQDAAAALAVAGRRSIEATGAVMVPGFVVRVEIERAA